MKTLVVEGWRFFPHSYAVVNQCFLLELLKRPGVALFHRDVPFVNPLKPGMPSMWSPEVEARLRAIPAPPEGLRPDAVLRVDWPHRFEPDPAARRTFVWGTTEYKTVENAAIPDWTPAAQVLPRITSTIIACSKWAAAGFLACGAPPERVVIVPCGVDPEQFHPSPTPEQRDAIRKDLGWEGKFVLLNISGMSPNKGIVNLLRAAAKLAARFPNLLVALKGTDTLYGSGGLMQRAMLELSAAESARLRPRLWYAGDVLSSPAVARLYRAADAYVSPYFAEGFNIPALEAAASGLPVICTRGGPTDEFLSEDVSLRINSYEQVQQGKHVLNPNPVHLAELIARAITDASLRSRMAAAGTAWARERFTWSHATDQLLSALFPD